MAVTVGDTGRLRTQLTGAQTLKVNLPPWAQFYSIYVESTAAVRVAPGDDATAVDGGAAATNYITVAVGVERSEPLPRKAHRAEQSLALYSAGAAVVVVSAYERA